MSHEKARRLERILKLEKLKERAIENRLARCGEKRDQNDQLSQMLHRTLAEEGAAMTGSLGETRSVDDLRRSRRYLDTVQETLTQVTEERARIEREFAAERGNWLRQRQRSDVLGDMSRSARARGEASRDMQQDLDNDDMAGRPKGD